MAGSASFQSCNVEQREIGIGRRCANWAGQLCFLILVSGVLFFAAACGNSSKQPEQRFHLEGTVVSIDRQQQELVVDHKDIPGFMGAMTMPYPVKPPFVLNQVSAGDQITADVIVSGNQYWLENVTVAKKVNPNAAPPAPPPPQVREPQPGDTVPDFALVNQDGKKIHLQELQGKSVLLTFIYTRCPLPDFCPAMSTKFSVIEEALAHNKEAFGKTHLLSISFDPKHDTPGVLRAYGAGYLQGAGEMDFSHWEFTVVPEDDVKEIAAFFGLAYMPDEDKFVHSLSTAIIAPNGKIYRFYAGKDWQTSAVLKDLVASTGS